MTSTSTNLLNNVQVIPTNKNNKTQSMSSSSTLPPLIELIQTNQVSVPQVQVPETPMYHILPPSQIKANKNQQKYNKKYFRTE